jgi:hypothetical protein
MVPFGTGRSQGKVNGNKLGVSQLTSLMWVYQFAQRRKMKN